MDTLESVDKSAVSRVPRPQGVFLVGSADVFEAVFESVRLSADRLAEVMARRPREAAAISRRHERVTRALSESARRDALRGESHRRSLSKPSRVDRLQSLARDADCAGDQAPDAPSLREGDHVKDARNGGSDSGQKPQTEADLRDARDCAAPEPTDDAAQDNAARSQEQVADVAADVAATGTPTGNEGSTRGSGGGVSSQPSSHRPRLAMSGPTTIPGGRADSSTRTPVIQLVSSPLPVHQQNQTTGRQAGSGSFPDASQPGAGKVAEAGGRPNAPSADFHNALQAASRLRGQFLRSPSQAAAAVMGKTAGANGVNLDDSRSVTELARIVRSHIGSRHSTMILRLDPPELGQLRIDVRMHDQMLTLRLEAQTLAGHEALQGRLTDLRTALEQHGIQLNQVEVEFRPGPSPASEPQNPNQQQESTPQWGESVSGEPAEHGETGAGGDGSAPSADANETMTSAGGDELLEAEEYDGIERPAETGVDVVV